MKIMNVKAKSVDWDANETASLKYVMGKRFKKNGYTHVKVSNVLCTGTVISGIVWIEPT